jgi:hypothetical protein
MPSTQREVIILRNDIGYLVKRTKPYIIRIRFHNFKTEAGRENYFHDLLMMFLIWRNEVEILGNFNSYREAFTHHQEDLIEMAQFE